MRQKPTAVSFDRAIRRVEELGVQLDLTKARVAFFATPVASAEKIDSVTGLLAIFAEHLSMVSNQIVVQTAHAESPVIARAKRFIQVHYTGALSLQQVASSVHVSIFYFCKLFRKATGISFTEFLSRTRIEAAKNLLLNPNLRITEIAFAVGFQSLTHFNRVFRNLVGESPTGYRRRLPKPPPGESNRSRHLAQRTNHPESPIMTRSSTCAPDGDGG
jgi:AraC-like DNA-binding protein